MSHPTKLDAVQLARLDRLLRTTDIPLRQLAKRFKVTATFIGLRSKALGLITKSSSPATETSVRVVKERHAKN